MLDSLTSARADFLFSFFILLERLVYVDRVYDIDNNNSDHNKMDLITIGRIKHD